MKKPKIIIPLIDALVKTDTQLQRGKTIQKFPITSLNTLTTVEERRLEWYDQTKNLLETIDENNVLVEDFHYLTPTAASAKMTTTDRVYSFRSHMNKDIQNLESIRHRIQLMMEVNQKKTKSSLDKKRSLTHAEKVWVWENKSRICYICNKKVRVFSEAYFDHTKAHAKKGKTTPANSGISHRLCNQLKGKKSLRQTKKYLGTS